MLPSLAQLNIETGKRTREENDDAQQPQQRQKKIRDLLQDLPGHLIELILFALNEQDCNRLNGLAHVNRQFAEIYKDQSFWEAAIQMNGWEVDWDTGLSPEKYFKMVCTMDETHRERLLAITKDTKVIPPYAFHNCTSLALTRLPDGLTHIEVYAFNRCRSLALTSLPVSLTTIEDGAFFECASLALTSLPVGLKEIGNDAFFECFSLALTSLPGGLEKIGSGAFVYCKNSR